MLARPKDPGLRRTFDHLCATRSSAETLVFADWLTERGSSLGEYIALSQAGRADDAAALWARDRTLWLGRLSPVLEQQPLEFEGGLPNLAKLKPEIATAAVLETSRYSEWLLFRALKLPSRRDGPFNRLLTSPELAWLQDVIGLTEKEATHLATHGHGRLESVHLRVTDARDALPSFERLPRLKTLSIKMPWAGQRNANIGAFIAAVRAPAARLEVAVRSLEGLEPIRQAPLQVKTLAIYLAKVGAEGDDFEAEHQREQSLRIVLNGDRAEVTVGGSALAEQLVDLAMFPLNGLQVSVRSPRVLTSAERLQVEAVVTSV